MQQQHLQQQDVPQQQNQKAKENPVAFLKGHDSDFNDAMNSITNMYDDLFPTNDSNLNVDTSTKAIFDDMNQLYDNIMEPSEEEKQRREQFKKEQELKKQKLEAEKQQPPQFVNLTQPNYYYNPPTENNQQQLHNYQQMAKPQQQQIPLQQPQQYLFYQVPQPQQQPIASWGYPVIDMSTQNQGMAINEVNLSTGQVIYRNIPQNPQMPQNVAYFPNYQYQQPQYEIPQYAQQQQNSQNYNYPRASFN